MAEPPVIRRRGRPKKPKGVSIEAIHDPIPTDAQPNWGDMTRLQVLKAVLNALQIQFADTGMPARDRTPASRAIASAAEQVQAEKQRIAALNPEPILPVDQSELRAEIAAGFESMPRGLLDGIAKDLAEIRERK